MNSQRGNPTTHSNRPHGDCDLGRTLLAPPARSPSSRPELRPFLVSPAAIQVHRCSRSPFHRRQTLIPRQAIRVPIAFHTQAGKWDLMWSFLANPLLQSGQKTIKGVLDFAWLWRFLGSSFGASLDGRVIPLTALSLLFDFSIRLVFSVVVVVGGGCFGWDSGCRLKSRASVRW